MEKSKSVQSLSKQHRVYSTCGAIDELIGWVGRCKAMHFNIGLDFTTPSSYQILIHHRLTKIQEDLRDIIKSLSISSYHPKHESTRFSSDRIRSLDESITSFRSIMFSGVPGNNLIESDLYLLSSFTKKCERLVVSSKDVLGGIIVDTNVVNYLAKLSEYFLTLITYHNKISRTVPENT